MGEGQGREEESGLVHIRIIALALLRVRTSSFHYQHYRGDSPNVGCAIDIPTNCWFTYLKVQCRFDSPVPKFLLIHVNFRRLRSNSPAFVSVLYASLACWTLVCASCSLKCASLHRRHRVVG